MKFGVPQGSILGLLVIEIYRNTPKFGKYNLTQGPLITFFGDFNHILQPSVLRAKVPDTNGLLELSPTVN